MYLPNLCHLLSVLIGGCGTENIDIVLKEKKNDKMYSGNPVFVNRLVSKQSVIVKVTFSQIIAL